MHAFIPSTWKADLGLLELEASLGYIEKTLSHKQINDKKKRPSNHLLLEAGKGTA